ncbi:MAG: cytochrome c3 family protein [Candidatus Methylomirabilales bacterium]
MTRGRRWLLLLSALLVARASLAWGQGIVGSKHDLSSVTGPGPVRALVPGLGGTTEICVFCHTPHNANPATDVRPLWNRNLSAAAYTVYTSFTLEHTAPTRPTGVSRLCLSCHDGSIPIGSVLNIAGASREIAMTQRFIPAQTQIGPDLRNSHPISFVFDAALKAADGQLFNPPPQVETRPAADVKLWDGGQVQCPSCHDPHRVQFPKFLRKPKFSQTDNLCIVCHDQPGWTSSTHRNALQMADFGDGDGSHSVAERACLSCHDPHTKAGATRLHREGANAAGVSVPSNTCFQCHKPLVPVVGQDVRTQFDKAGSRHPISRDTSTTNSGHEPIITTVTGVPPNTALPEDVLLVPGLVSARGVPMTKHVECTDCHNPHRVRASNRTEGIRGIDTAGAGSTVVLNVINDPELPDGIQRQFQLCFRCHGVSFDRFIPLRFDGTGQPVRTTVGEPASLNTSGSNKFLEFQPSNSAFHPVVAAGRNTSTALRNQLAAAGLNTGSIIKCTDCHNNDEATVRGRVSNTPTAVSGPHGSVYTRLLRGRYVTDPRPFTRGPFNENNFQLCFFCHDVNAFNDASRNRSDLTNFFSSDRDNLHWFHLTRIDGDNGFGNALCHDCHYNVHSNVEAANTLFEPPPDGDTHLVNFDPPHTAANAAKPLWFFNPPNTTRFGETSPSRNTISCDLVCHGAQHDDVDKFFYEFTPS